MYKSCGFRASTLSQLSMPEVDGPSSRRVNGKDLREDSSLRSSSPCSRRAVANFWRPVSADAAHRTVHRCGDGVPHRTEGKYLRSRLCGRIGGKTPTLYDSGTSWSCGPAPSIDNNVQQADLSVSRAFRLIYPKPERDPFVPPRRSVETRGWLARFAIFYASPPEQHRHWWVLP